MKWLVSSGLGIVAVFLLLFGCLFASVGGAVYYFTIYTVRDWVPVPGVVTRFETSNSTDSDGFSSTTYCPHVEYTTTSGDTYNAYINECSNPRAYDVGETVTVIYNPAQPDQAQLQGGAREVLGNILGLGFIVLGCLPMAIGLVLVIIAAVVAARRSRGPTLARP